MTSSTNYSDINVRPRRTRGVRSSKKSILYSDYNAEEDSKSGNLGQRSISLTALPHAGPGTAPAAPTPTPGPPLEPRMAQLETLEAKMASIEVSLSTTPRRKNGKKNGNGQIGLVGKTSTIGSTSAVNILASVRSNNLVDTCRELEVLRNALKDKENTIQNLQGQMNCCGRLTSPQPLDAAERRSAELRLQSLKQEEESRKTAIKKINLALEQIDGSESNIDVRIRQAELEYELGREELGLLGVREEMRALQARLDAKPTPTLYSCVGTSGRSVLHSVQLEYDPKSPRFGAGNADDKIGLFVLWAAEDSGLQKGDRVLEVNGKLTLSTSKEEMIRLLTVCPSRAEIVVQRAWTPPPSTEDFLRRENLRLTHRISYLEDQVSELLLQKEKISVPVKIPSYEKKQMEVFQKGPQVTLLSNPEITRSINHSTTVTINSNAVPKGPTSPSGEPIGHEVTKNGCSIPVGPSQKYHEVDSYHSFQPKLQSAGEKIKALSKKYEKDEFSSTLTKNKYKYENEEDEAHNRKPLISVQNSKSTTSLENPYSLSDMERSNRKNGQFYNRVVDYSSETSCPRYRSHRDRSVKSLDLDAIEDGRGRYKSTSADVTNNSKPTPPKKPIRLSIHRATSLQNVEVGYSLHNAVRKMKRSHKGEAPQPPGFNDAKMNGSDASHIGENVGSRTSTWVTPADAAPSHFRWPGQYHRNRSKSSNEKWC